MWMGMNGFCERIVFEKIFVFDINKSDFIVQLVFELVYENGT